MLSTFKSVLYLLAFIVMTVLFMNCSQDTYEIDGHDHTKVSKNEVSFSAFKKETQQNHVGLFKSVTLENQFSKGTIESEFIIDTTKIFKHIAQNNKTTYSFRIYPIDTNALQPHEYYNLVYHKSGNQWDELLFHNKEAIHPQTGDYRLQSSDMIYRSPRQEQSSKSPSLSAVPMCETVDVSIQCDGSCNGSCDGFACPTGQCIKTTVSYQYCGTIGGGGGGTGGTGGISGESGGGGGLDGVYIPNPYEGEDDVTSPDFVFALDVARFINTLPSNLKQVVQANPFLHNTIINFMKDNGGLNTENKNRVTFALTNYNSIASIPMSNVAITTINQLHYWAFNYLLENPNTEAVNFAKEVVDALKEDGEVDLVNNIIYTINKPCQKEIVKDVLSTSSPFTDLIKQTFNTSDKVNLKFYNGIIPYGSPAATNNIVEGSPDNFTIKIKFDDNYLNSATNLSIAANTLHELVHAYLLSLYLKNQLVATDKGYNKLLNAFINFYKDKDEGTYLTVDLEIHNAMKSFMSKMANSLYNYAKSKNIPGITADYCEHLAWGTMNDTDLFKKTLTPQQQQDYENIAAIEQDNLQSAAGSACN